jgi:hypothetical protein
MMQLPFKEGCGTAAILLQHKLQCAAAHCPTISTSTCTSMHGLHDQLLSSQCSSGTAGSSKPFQTTIAAQVFADRLGAAAATPTMHVSVASSVSAAT